jgi:hypothetical protein
MAGSSKVTRHKWVAYRPHPNATYPDTVHKLQIIHTWLIQIVCIDEGGKDRLSSHDTVEFSSAVS